MMSYQCESLTLHTPRTLKTMLHAYFCFCYDHSLWWYVWDMFVFAMITAWIWYFKRRVWQIQEHWDPCDVELASSIPIACLRMLSVSLCTKHPSIRPVVYYMLLDYTGTMSPSMWDSKRHSISVLCAELPYSLMNHHGSKASGFPPSLATFRVLALDSQRPRIHLDRTWLGKARSFHLAKWVEDEVKNKTRLRTLHFMDKGKLVYKCSDSRPQSPSLASLHIFFLLFQPTQSPHPNGTTLRKSRPSRPLLWSPLGRDTPQRCWRPLEPLVAPRGPWWGSPSVDPPGSWDWSFGAQDGPRFGGLLQGITKENCKSV